MRLVLCQPRWKEVRVTLTLDDLPLGESYGVRKESDRFKTSSSPAQQVGRSCQLFMVTSWLWAPPSAPPFALCPWTL